MKINEIMKLLKADILTDNIDKNDNVKSEYKYLLTTACDISIDKAVKIVVENKGIVVPAHIDRMSYSIISTLGTIPDYLGFEYVEVSKNITDAKKYLDLNNIKKYKIIRSSDAHRLGDILEKEFYLEEVGLFNKISETHQIL